MNAENNKPESRKNGSDSLLTLMSYTVDKTLELADANSVAGDIIDIDGVKVIPISKISAGFAGGGASIVNVTAKKSNTPAGTGARVTVTPLSFLIIANGEARVVTVNGAETEKGGFIGKILEAVKQLKKPKKEEKEEEITETEVKTED